MRCDPDSIQPIVCVIDDDAAMRESIDTLIRSVGLGVRLFAEPSEFLTAPLPSTISCLVLDVRLPRLSGLEFQSELVRSGIHIPVIFITGYGDIPMSVRAMKAGAIEFLTKPFRDQDLLDAIQVALERDKARLMNERANASLLFKFSMLTRREQEVMKLVTSGLMNKQIAGKVGISEVTVKLHRANVMRKMQASSLPELVKMADIIKGVEPGMATNGRPGAIFCSSNLVPDVMGGGGDIPLFELSGAGRTRKPPESGNAL
jgi:FixJ family two-component response regulator